MSNSIWGNVQGSVTAGVNVGKTSTLEGASVTASINGSDYTQSTTTDSEGNWWLENLEIGFYDLTASKKGYYSGTDSTQSKVLVSASSDWKTSPLIQLILYKDDPAKE
jgi:hypothetical protein